MLERTRDHAASSEPAQVLIREARAHRRRRLSIIATSVVAVVIAAVLAVGGVTWWSAPTAETSGGHGRPGTPTFLPPGAEPAGWSVSYPIRLPAAFPILGGIATNVTTGETWILANSTSSYQRPASSALFAWNSRRHRLIYVETLPEKSSQGFAAPMAVAPDGDVWIGLGGILVRVTPTSRRVTTVPLPTVHAGVGADTAADPLDPHDPVDSLAVSGTGTLVVGREYATTVQLVNPTTLAVSSIPLPADTVVGRDWRSFSDVTIDRSGQDVAVVLVAQPHGHTSTIHELGQYVGGSWFTSDAHCQAWDASFSGERLAVTDIAGCIADGTFVAHHGPVRLTFPPGIRVRLEPQAVALADGSLVTDSPRGVVALRAGTETKPFSFGETVVDSIGGETLSNKSSLRYPRYVPIGPIRYVWTGGTSAWFIPGGIEGTVGLLARTARSS